MQLFIKDKFSINNPAWYVIKDKSIKLEILSKVPSSLINYLGDIKSIKSPGNFEINSSNILISGSKKTVVLKTFNQLNKKELENQIIIYKKVLEKKLPCPNIINTNKGYFFQLEKDKYGIALDFIKGKYFNGTKSQLIQTASAIASCLNETRLIKCNNFKVNKIFPENSSQLIRRFMDVLSNTSNFSNIEILFIKKNYNTIISTANEVSQKISIFDNINFEMFHRDLHPHNILIYKNKVNLIDVDSILPTKWPIAYGFAMFKLLRQFCVKNKFNYQNIKLMQNFIKSLASVSEGESASYRILFLGAKIEILRRVLFIMEENLKNKTSLWNPVLNIQIRALTEVKYMENKII